MYREQVAVHAALTYLAIAIYPPWKVHCMHDIIVSLNLLRYQMAELRSHLQSELKA